MKIVVNRCFGGFGLSHKAMVAYAKRKGKTLHWFWHDYSTGETHIDEEPPERVLCMYGTEPAVKNPDERGFTISEYIFPEGCYLSEYDIERDDPDLVAAVEELGDEAAGFYARLDVVEIPDDVNWEIHDYDGQESIHEVHRSW